MIRVYTYIQTCLSLSNGGPSDASNSRCYPRAHRQFDLWIHAVPKVDEPQANETDGQ